MSVDPEHVRFVFAALEAAANKNTSTIYFGTESEQTGTESDPVLAVCHIYVRVFARMSSWDTPTPVTQQRHVAQERKLSSAFMGLWEKPSYGKRR